jgi:AcrR family transcriptional regulator
MARTGRRPGAPGTRERIREAARETFAHAGFDGATIRAIAKRASVDPALVHHYFGSKQELFVASMQLPFEPSAVLPPLLAGDRAKLGERLAGLAIRLWEEPATRPVMFGIARSATSDARAAAALRGLFETQLLPAIRGLGIDQPDLRAALAWSQLVGFALARYVLQVRPLTEANPRDLAVALGFQLQAALTGPLPGNTVHRTRRSA